MIQKPVQGEYLSAHQRSTQSGIKLFTLACFFPVKELVLYWHPTQREILTFVRSVMVSEVDALLPVEAVALLGGSPSSQGFDQL